MPRQIIIEFEYGSDKSPPLYRGLDFNESLFRLARNDEWTSFPPDQIDETTDNALASKLRADRAECWPGSRSS